MSDTLERATWVQRVLGVTVPSGDGETGIQPRQPTPEQRDPFQIFVKSLDNVTLTLSLPRDHETTIAELHGLIEDRTGIEPGEQNLTTGTKPFNSQHGGLPISEYGIQRNQTLSLQGRLKGGFGERAAVAEIMLREIKRGNVFGDIQSSKGQSNKDLLILRHLTTDDNPIGKEYLNSVANKAVERGLCEDNEKARQEWLANNRHFIKSIATTSSKAGNCMEHAEHVYAELLTKTTGQTVYQVSMTGEDGDLAFDHRFVVTSPDNHKKDISGLMSDGDAMAVDAWWQNKICTFKKFAAGENPYDHKMKAANLVIRYFQEAKGQGLDPTVAQFATEEFKRVRDENAEGKGIVSKQRSKNLEKLVEKSETVEKLSDDHDECQRLFEAAEKEVREWTEEVQMYVSDIEKKKLEIEELKKAGTDQAVAQKELEKLEIERGESEGWLVKETEARDKAQEKLDEADRALEEAADKLRESTKNFGGVFGSLFESWDKPMDDTRTQDELFLAWDQASLNGAPEQLETDLEAVTDEQLVDYLVSNASRATAVLNAPNLVTRFQKFCHETTDDDLKDIRGLISEENVDKHVKSVEALNLRLTV